MPGDSSMTDVVLLNAGPLGMVSHPRASVDIVEWLASLVASGVRVMIPEIADYELRRELLPVGRSRGVERLDQLRVSLEFVPITSEAMLLASGCGVLVSSLHRRRESPDVTPVRRRLLPEGFSACAGPAVVC